MKFEKRQKNLGNNKLNSNFWEVNKKIYCTVHRKLGASLKESNDNIVMAMTGFNVFLGEKKLPCTSIIHRVRCYSAIALPPSYFPWVLILGKLSAQKAFGSPPPFFFPEKRHTIVALVNEGMRFLTSNRFRLEHST